MIGFRTSILGTWNIWWNHPHPNKGPIPRVSSIYIYGISISTYHLVDFYRQILVNHTVRSLPWKICHEGRSYDFFVEAKSAAGPGPASRSMALTAFAASKPSVPQEFDVDLQSLSKGWGVFFCIPKIPTPGDPPICWLFFLVGKLAFIQIVGADLVGCFCWWWVVFFYRNSTRIFRWS